MFLEKVFPKKLEKMHKRQFLYTRIVKRNCENITHIESLRN